MVLCKLMKIRIKYIVCFLLFFIIVGCSRITTTTPINSIRIDTIVVKEILKDTIVLTEIKREYIEKQTTDTISILSTSLASSTAEIKDNKLHHVLEQKDTTLPVRVVYKDRIVEKIKTEKKEIPVEVIVEKPIRDNIFWFSIIFNIITLSYIILKIYFKYIKTL